ncbi:MAG: class I SAM-dependent methyltransferase [Xanthobacteraceae bacterium]|jgi:SAM-dependent methyltransferase
MALPTACPLCGASADQQSVVVPRVYGDDTRRAVFACAVCDVRYLFPGLAPDEEQRLYAAEFESFMAKRSGPDAGWEGPERHIAVNEAQRQRRMKHLAGLIAPNSRILEVGGGSGFMLYPLVAEGHECVAIEPSGIFSEYVSSRGIRCFRTISELCDCGSGAGEFDLILHYYVMEHLADPVAFLRSQLGLLKPGGRIVLEVPNANDALTVLYEIPAYARFIWVVSHRWYFTEKSLAATIAKAGGRGEVRLDQRYDLSNHIVWARDGRPGGMGRFTHTLGEEIEDSYRQALIRARVCDTLIGMVQK